MMVTKINVGQLLVGLVFMISLAGSVSAQELSIQQGLSDAIQLESMDTPCAAPHADMLGIVTGATGAPIPASWSDMVRAVESCTQIVTVATETMSGPVFSLMQAWVDDWLAEHAGSMTVAWVNSSLRVILQARFIELHGHPEP